MKWLSKSLAIGVFTFAAVFDARALAYTARTVAVDSNLLVSDGKVLFAQGTGSLTQIDLATGNVLDRISPPDGVRFGGTLYVRDEGIVLANYGKVTLLDADSFEIVWTVDNANESAIGEHHFIAHDGYHTVTCFDIETGRKRWSKSLEGGWRLLANGDTAAVRTPEYYDKDQAMWVFDMPSGKELFSRRAEPGQEILNVYLDGETVHLLTGKREPGQIDAVPLRLISMDKTGKELANIDVQSPNVIWEYGYKTAGHNFFVGKRCFTGDGRVRDAFAFEPELLESAWKIKDTIADSLPSGIYLEGSIQDSKGERGTLLGLKRPDGEWQGYTSHLGEDGWIVHYVEGDGCIVVSSSQGHVECIEVATGKARWLYVFPVIRRTASYSGNAMPPMLSQQAADYRRGLAKLGAAGGTLPLPLNAPAVGQVLADVRNAVSYPGKIVVDPSPDDPYAKLLPKLVYRCIGCALAPAAILAAFIAVLWKFHQATMKDQTAAIRFSAVDFSILSVLAWMLTFSPVLGLLIYGRIDPTTTCFLFGSVAACVAVAVYAGWNASRIRRNEIGVAAS